MRTHTRTHATTKAVLLSCIYDTQDIIINYLFLIHR